MVEVSADDVSVPTSLIESSNDGPRVAVMDCTGTPCPAVPGHTLACTSLGVCDPAPFAITLAMQDVDLRDDPHGGRGFYLSLRRAEYVPGDDTLDVALPELEVYWGPPDATEIDAGMGVRLLMTVPAGVAQASAVTPLDFDALGSQALSDRVAEETNQRAFRVFVRALIDPAPADPIPQGHVTGTLHLAFEADEHP